MAFAVWPSRTAKADQKSSSRITMGFGSLDSRFSSCIAKTFAKGLSQCKSCILPEIAGCHIIPLLKEISSRNLVVVGSVRVARMFEEQKFSGCHIIPLLKGISSHLINTSSGSRHEIRCELHRVQLAS
ncbi:hypothetical protein E3N88_40446 [Mikania micrantha]|uniref:Uncharacterized protein n=1 Tax=Mikania micrantha TaxID=192012 RepID=A0A5N6LMR5_9ASTR|nr:hypothetical protein E3N88_40446 [Mikania micrantha]